MILYKICTVSKYSSKAFHIINYYHLLSSLISSNRLIQVSDKQYITLLLQVGPPPNNGHDAVAQDIMRKSLDLRSGDDLKMNENVVTINEVLLNFSCWVIILFSY